MRVVSARSAVQFCMAKKSLCALQRRIAVLKSLQSRLLWPPVTKFQAFGQTYSFPCQSSQVVATSLPEPSLGYLAGFFDGDGCVSVIHPNSSPALSIGQSLSRADVIMLFVKAFGGTVYKSGNGTGLKQPTLQWMVVGSSAKSAAVKLAPYSFVKRDQLLLASAWPVEKHKQSLARQELKCLKSMAADAHFACSWPYVAGFFDAEGCIRFRPAQTAVQTCFAQKQPGVLHWIAAFLQADLDVASFWHRQRCGTVTMTIYARHDTHLVMRRLMAHGLLAKKPQALLALSIREMPYNVVRNRAMRLSGNQSRYRRLTDDGCERARAIALAGGALRRIQAAGSDEEAAHLSRQLQAMKEDHEVRNAFSTYRTLQIDIRALLAQGATVSTKRVRPQQSRTI